MNKIFIAGRIGKEPELRFTQSQKAVVSFSVATSKKIKEKEITTWHDVVAWEGTANFIASYFTKGDFCAIEGEIEHQQWTDKDGVKKYRTMVVCREFNGVGTKKQKPQPQEFNQYQQQRPEQGQDYHDLDNIPF
jgi:single-strand DNA-binding protein